MRWLSKHGDAMAMVTRFLRYKLRRQKEPEGFLEEALAHVAFSHWLDGGHGDLSELGIL